MYGDLIKVIVKTEIEHSTFQNSTAETCRILRKQCTWLYCWAKSSGELFSQVALLLLGFILLLSAFSEPSFAYDGSKYSDVCNNLIELAAGGFGAMLTAIAGVGAIVASAMGGFKAAWACLVVSVGSFIIGAYIELFFGKCGA